jgi:tRNA pseudouridine synthase 10
MIGRIPAIAKKIASDLKGYEFETFLVGTSLPQKLLDKEDEIRSHYKIRGTEAIKSEITRMITTEIVRQTRKTVEYARPDVTILAMLDTGEEQITPRSIWLMARYKKEIRGLAQRSSFCNICNGLGCASCNYKGSNESSIQSLVSSYFGKKFRAEGCSFIWVGSEDEKSLVNGDGRPFYVEIRKPMKRKISKTLLNSVSISEGLSLKSLYVLPSRPKSIPQFRMKCLVYLSNAPESNGAKENSEQQQSKVMINEIESKFRDLLVQVKISRKFRTVSRKIRYIKVMQNQERHPYVLEIDCDGGIPIRKLVLGNDNTVSPNLSSYISGYVIDPELPFDILDVTLIESNSNKMNSSRDQTRVSSWPKSKPESSEDMVDEYGEERKANVVY